MSHLLLKRNELPLHIDIHTDLYSVLPAALSQRRAFKKNKIVQEDYEDWKDGPVSCPFCNLELLVGNPAVTYHEGSKVISFPNAAPFLPGDQRLLVLWHEDRVKRYEFAHRFLFQDFGVEEFYYLVKAAVELASGFLNCADGEKLQQELNLIRCVAGFNLGRLAGQSVPHFHLQYGWEIVLDPRPFNQLIRDLYYQELDEEKLLLLGDDPDIYLVVPWTPKGQYHVEIHFKRRYQLADLDEREIRMLAFVSSRIMKLYQAAGIKNVNVLYTGSPLGKSWEPLRVQFVPRVNMTALYEMIGVNVVDTPPQKIAAFFSDLQWSEVMAEANQFIVDGLYEKRFNPPVQADPLADGSAPATAKAATVDPDQQG